jgi:hypothetical protein
LTQRFLVGSIRMALAEYFATLPFRPQDAPEKITFEVRPDVVGPDPAKVGEHRRTKIVRGLDVAVINDFGYAPGGTMDLPGLPTDDIQALAKEFARGPEPEKMPQFRPGPKLKDLSFDRPVNSLADLLAQANQDRQAERDALFREALLKEGLTVEEVRAAEIRERVARVKAGRMPAPAVMERGMMREAAPLTAPRRAGEVPTMAPAIGIGAPLDIIIPGMRPRARPMVEEIPTPPESVPAAALKSPGPAMMGAAEAAPRGLSALERQLAAEFGAGFLEFGAAAPVAVAEERRRSLPQAYPVGGGAGAISDADAISRIGRAGRGGVARRAVEARAAMLEAARPGGDPQNYLAEAVRQILAGR